MGDKYQEAIGKWEHTIGKITHVMIPEEDDNYKFLRAKSEGKKADSDEILFKGVGKIYFDMVMRSEPEMLPELQESLKNWIGVNIGKIIEDFIIAFRWTSEEKLKEVKAKN